MFGGQLGYNWQTANWVFGIETDAQWTGQKGSTTVLCPVAGCFPTAVAAGTGVGAALSDKLEWFGTFRGRGGILVTPSVLLYVTGGLAYGSLQTEVALSGFTATGIPVTAIGSRSSDKFGWTIGGGIESMFAANWSAKIEYLYMDLGSISNSVVLPTAVRIPARRKRHQPRDGQHHPRRHQLSLLGGPGVALLLIVRPRPTQKPRGDAPGLLPFVGACHSRSGGDKGQPIGRLAQLVERLLYTQDVGGSSPSSPTSLRRETVQVTRRSPKGEGGGPERRQRARLARDSP